MTQVERPPVERPPGRAHVKRERNGKGPFSGASPGPVMMPLDRPSSVPEPADRVQLNWEGNARRPARFELLTPEKWLRVQCPRRRLHRKASAWKASATRARARSSKGGRA